MIYKNVPSLVLMLIANLTITVKANEDYMQVKLEAEQLEDTVARLMIENEFIRSYSKDLEVARFGDSFSYLKARKIELQREYNILKIEADKLEDVNNAGVFRGEDVSEEEEKTYSQRAKLLIKRLKTSVLHLEKEKMALNQRLAEIESRPYDTSRDALLVDLNEQRNRLKSLKLKTIELRRCKDPVRMPDTVTQSATYTADSGTCETDDFVKVKLEVKNLKELVGKLLVESESIRDYIRDLEVARFGSDFQASAFLESRKTELKKMFNDLKPQVNQMEMALDKKKFDGVCCGDGVSDEEKRAYVKDAKVLIGRLKNTAISLENDKANFQRDLTELESRPYDEEKDMTRLTSLNMQREDYDRLRIKASRLSIELDYLS